MRIFLSTVFMLFLLTASAQDLYNTNQITFIEITFPDDDWHQNLNDFYAAGNGERLLGVVEINGESFDSVGIRYRGGSTYDATNIKNPLNIKLDHVKNQDYQGYEVMKLSNGAKDPSWLREVLGFEIARNVMEAPKANFASVYVNGNFLGLYTNVESLNAKFFSEQFQSNSDNSRFEANPTYSLGETPNPPFGCDEGHGAALEFLGQSDACYFEHYELQSTIGWADLRELTAQLENTPNNVRDFMDFDRFIWMSAFNSLLTNLDSYLGASPQNYHIYRPDNLHWVPVINDLNESFGRSPWLTIPAAGDPQPPLDFYTDLDPFTGEGDTQKPLLNAMFSNSTTNKKYIAHMRTMIEELFSSGWFEERAEALRELINDEVFSDNNHFYTYDDFLNNYEQTVVDNFDGEDAYGVFQMMDQRIAFLLQQPAFQAVPPTINNVSASPNMPTPNTNVNITAAIDNANDVKLGYRDNLTSVFELTDMFDDGNHGDGTAGDGVFGATVSVPVGGLQYYVYAENADAGQFAPTRAEFIFYELNTSGSLVINELIASNQSTVSDQDGEFDDWAELYNNSSDIVDISGWYLSDDPQNLTKYQFPAGVIINPNSYLTIWCDDDEDQPGLHTTFNLNADGEALILVRPDLSIADQIVFDGLPTDVAFARCPNGVGSFTLLQHTFGADNTSACVNNAEEAARKIDLKAYPNPVSDILQIETNLTTKTTATLWSAIGQPIKSFEFNGKTAISVAELPSGLYYLSIAGGAGKRILVINE